MELFVSNCLAPLVLLSDNFQKKRRSLVARNPSRLLIFRSLALVVRWAGPIFLCTFRLMKRDSMDSVEAWFLRIALSGRLSCVFALAKDEEENI